MDATTLLQGADAAYKYAGYTSPGDDPGIQHKLAIFAGLGTFLALLAVCCVLGPVFRTASTAVMSTLQYLWLAGVVLSSILVYALIAYYF